MIPFSFSCQAVLILLAAFKASKPEQQNKRITEINPKGILIKEANEISAQGILLHIKTCTKGVNTESIFVPGLIVTPIKVAREHVIELPFNEIMQKMKRDEGLKKYITSEGQIISQWSTETVNENGEITVKIITPYYLQIHTHPYMTSQKVTPSSLDINARNLIAEYTPRVCTMICNETIEKFFSFILHNPLLFPEDITVAQEVPNFECSVWFSDTNNNYGSIKSAQIIAGKYGTYCFEEEDEDGGYMEFYGPEANLSNIEMTLKGFKHTCILYEEKIYTYEDIFKTKELWKKMNSEQKRNENLKIAQETFRKITFADVKEAKVKGEIIEAINLANEKNLLTNISESFVQEAKFISLKNKVLEIKGHKEFKELGLYNSYDHIEEDNNAFVDVFYPELASLVITTTNVMGNCIFDSVTKSAANSLITVYVTGVDWKEIKKQFSHFENFYYTSIETMEDLIKTILEQTTPEVKILPEIPKINLKIIPTTLNTTIHLSKFLQKCP